MKTNFLKKPQKFDVQKSMLKSSKLFLFKMISVLQMKLNFVMLYQNNTLIEYPSLGHDKNFDAPTGTNFFCDSSPWQHQCKTCGQVILLQVPSPQSGQEELKKKLSNEEVYFNFFTFVYRYSHLRISFLTY